MWRFFSGAFMNGATYNDATWWRDASTMYRKRRLSYTWWRRKARMKRAAWRNGIFWPGVLVTSGLMFFTSWTIAAMVILLPPLSFVAFKRIRPVFFIPVTSGNDDGSVNQHWLLKVRYRRIWERVTRQGRSRPGLAMPSEIARVPRVREIPSEVRGAVVAELDGQPPIEMKLLMTPDD
jgi:hypothetical protein